MRLLLVFAGLAVVASSQAAPASFGTPLDVRLHVERVSEDADGVHHVDSWNDRLIRRPGHVWKTRLRSPAPASTQLAVHEDFDYARAQFHAFRGKDGELAVEYASDTKVVDVPRSEWEQAGFNGNIAAMASVIDPAVIAGFKPLARPSRRAGARWYARSAGRRTERLLWSQNDQFAWAVEVDDPAARFSQRITATRQPAPKVLPWAGYASLERHDFTDFLD